VSGVALLLAAPLLVACSSEDAPATPVPCNQDPWTCPAGQTCWPKDQAGAFACLNSAAGVKLGDACTNTIGTPSCGDRLACFQAVGAATGTCVAYCDRTKADRGCGAGQTCQTATLAGTSATFSICVGGMTTSDAGTDTAMGSDTAMASDTAMSTDAAETSVSDSSDGG
jgi:hypothetical protein